ncbi:MAG: CBU_0592 family membrane protein [Actinomycetota bacterium]
MSELLSALIGLVGWVGAAVIVGAYALVTNGRVSPGSVAYQGFNIGGAAALALSATVSGAWPLVATNLIWVVIGAQAILSLKHVAVRLLAIRVARRIHVLLGDPRGEAAPAMVPTTVGPLPLPIR